jgi:uncharacterized protein (DUF1778 family)
MNIKELILRFLGKKEQQEYESFRDQRIYIRLTQEEKEIIEGLAKNQRRDTSNFVRWLALEKYLDEFIKVN